MGEGVSDQAKTRNTGNKKINDHHKLKQESRCEDGNDPTIERKTLEHAGTCDRQTDRQTNRQMNRQT